MRVTLSKYAGFCPGVRNADKTVNRLLSDNDRCRIYTIGKLIHNRLYIEELVGRGVEPVELDKIPEIYNRAPHIPMTVVIRTHGITREQKDFLSEFASSHPNFTVVDATCGYVKNIHKIAEKNTSDGTVFLLYCVPEHPEAIGILSYAKGEKHAFSSLSELEAIDLGDKIPILCSQTTQNLVEFKKIKNFLKKLCTNAKIFDTICNVTENRQNEAIEIAKASDLMIVIGGHESSNTGKLFDLCSRECADTRWIESVADLTIDFPDGAKSAGITAGASTPDGIITEVYKAMEENFNQMLEGSLKSLHTGETVVGTVFTIGENEIKLDLGAKFTGVLTKDQITDDPAAKLSEMFKIGDEIEVFVIRVEDGKGIATVSKKRVDRDNNWVILRDAHESGEVLEGKVVSAIKGGVLLSVAGNNVFVPASQTGIAKGGDLSAIVGTEQKIKVIEFDPAKKRAVGSIKVILNEEKKAKEEAVWASLEVGQAFTGVVKNLTPYGAFVDIGGVDGMVHNTELSWKRIKHPSQVVSVGQAIPVFIKELDAEKKRISLGYKTQEMDTWFQFTQKFNVGDVVSAKIVSIMPFGAFAEVYEDVDGLIHISRISTKKVNSPADVLSVGQVVDVKITEINNEERRLALSIRALMEEAEKAEKAKADAEAQAIADAEAEAEAKRLEEERADMAPYLYNPEENND